MSGVPGTAAVPARLVAGSWAPDTFIGLLLAVILVVGLLLIWRLVLRDPSTRRVRFGVFYERDQDEKERE